MSEASAGDSDCGPGLRVPTDGVAGDSGEPDGAPWFTSRLDQLKRISTELTAATTANEAASRLIATLGASPGPATHGLWLHLGNHPDLVLAAQVGMPEEAVARFASIDVGADIPVAVAHREQRTVQSTNRAQSERDFEGLQGATRLTDGFVAVPLVVGGMSLGALSLGFQRQPTPEDVIFMEAIASQMAQALTRIRLSEREQQRQAELEFLVQLTDAAMAAENHGELMANVAAAAVPTLGDWCAIHYLPVDGGPPEVAVAHVDPTKVSWARELQARYPYVSESETGVPAVIRSGRTEVMSARDAELIDEAIAKSGIDETEARLILDSLGLTSVITVPLRTKQRTAGAIQFVSAESGREYVEEDVALAEVVASRLADPLDSAWTADQQAHVAGTLQRNLLPPRLPVIDGVDLAVRYLPAGVSSVGGDFYDVFSITDQSWAVLIGDACGTGPDAAALSSIARHTVRAAARHGQDHLAVIDWLNQAVALSDRNLFCTACYATLAVEHRTWVLQAAAAGHPLPILVRPSGTTSLGRAGTLLGVFDDVDIHVERTELAPGNTVVFYTDGVTDLPPPYGMTSDELNSVLATMDQGLTANEIADTVERSITTRVDTHQRIDDVALVVVRIRS